MRKKKKTKKVSNAKLIDIITDNGVGYTFTNYLGPEEIEDDKISALAKIVVKAIEEIEDRLGI